jgi:hypothetical protein
VQYRRRGRAQVYVGQSSQRSEARCLALAEDDPRVRGRAREDVQLDGRSRTGEIRA